MEQSTLVAGTRAENSRLKVLAAEDNPVLQSMLRGMLTTWGYNAVIARNGAEAFQQLISDDAPRLAILDWMMPGMDGVEICRRLRAAAREPYIYLLLLTARTEAADLVEGMEAGADDYLTKPFNSQELRVRLRAGTRILELQEQLLHAREALRQQATHDGLTGLLNRSCILEILSNELARADREGKSVAVLMVDIDNFKPVNDTYGHLAGDAVLRELSGRMRSVIRRYDSVGRYGGEEFIVVLPGCDGPSAWLQAERVREAFAGRACQAGAQSIPITCSIGVASHSAEFPPDSDALIRSADAALYSAKHLGRNRVEMAVGAGGLPQLAHSLAMS
jgi:diguanylate cyclase (GGDEF)-like protein